MGEDQRQLLPSYHHQLDGPRFGTQRSFVDEIKLNYSLANTTLHISVRVAISGCVHSTVSVKISLSELL